MNEDYSELVMKWEEDSEIVFLPENNPDFKFEYAFESITVKNTLYREISNEID